MLPAAKINFSHCMFISLVKWGCKEVTERSTVVYGSGCYINDGMTGNRTEMSLGINVMGSVHKGTRERISNVFDG